MTSITFQPSPAAPWISPRVQRTRARALAAARQILLDEGWDALTQQRVADLAGIGRATVYRHWPDRVALLQDVCSAEMTTLHTVPSGDLRNDLCAELEAMRHELIEGRFDKILVTLTDRCLWDRELLSVKSAVLGEGTGTVRAILADAVARGELTRDLDLDEAVSYLVAPIVYRHLFAEQRVDTASLHRTVEDFLTLRRLAGSST